MRVGSWPWLCPQRILMTLPADQWAQPASICDVPTTLKPVKFLSRLSRLCVGGQGGPDRLCVGGLVCRTTAAAIAAKIGADHCEAASKQGRHVSPHQMRLRKPVQQEDSRSRPEAAQKDT